MPKKLTKVTVYRDGEDWCDYERNDRGWFDNDGDVAEPEVAIALDRLQAALESGPYWND